MKIKPVAEWKRTLEKESVTHVPITQKRIQAV
jgi:hypothetical protein